MLVLMYRTTISRKPTVLRHHHARHCVTSLNIATVLATDYGLNDGETVVQFPGRENRLYTKASGSASGSPASYCVCSGGGLFPRGNGDWGVKLTTHI